MLRIELQLKLEVASFNSSEYLVPQIWPGCPYALPCRVLDADALWKPEEVLPRLVVKPVAYVHKTSRWRVKILLQAKI